MGQYRVSLWLRARRSGFTIVELLIVVVVIALLAAITIVAYSGMRSLAGSAALDSSLSMARKKVLMYSAEHSDDSPGSLTYAGVVGSDVPGQTTYRYSAGTSSNPGSFCITAVGDGHASYVSDIVGVPRKGYCSGHDNESTYATNLIPDGSFERDLVYSGDCNSDAPGWCVHGGMVIERESGKFKSGGNSLKVILPNDGLRSSSASYCFGARGGSYYALGASIMSERSLEGSERGLDIVLYGSGSSQYGGGGLSTAWQWRRAETLSGVSGVLCLNLSSRDMPGATFYLDDLMVYETPSLQVSLPARMPYRDGDSPLWIWNGDPSVSSSTGPRP